MTRHDVIALRQWGRHSGYYEVAWRQDRVLRHRQDGPPPASWGFAKRCGHDLVLLYRRPSDDHVILQTGRAQFDVDKRTLRTSYRSLFLASFLSVEDGSTRTRLALLTLGHLFALVDPSYDGLDEEEDDFLLFLHQHLASPEWADHVRRRWGSSAEDET